MYGLVFNVYCFLTWLNLKVSSTLNMVRSKDDIGLPWCMALIFFFKKHQLKLYINSCPVSLNNYERCEWYEHHIFVLEDNAGMITEMESYISEVILRGWQIWSISFWKVIQLVMNLSNRRVICNVHLGIFSHMKELIKERSKFSNDGR